MALSATHLKFALDLRPLLKVSNLDDYCAGAVYPDSRYVTGIDRRATHSGNSPQDPFVDGLTDFERGWAVHNIYDKMSGPFYMNLMDKLDDDLISYSRTWCYLTALKIVEDMTSFAHYGDNTSFLHNLHCDFCPLNESEEKLVKYFVGLRDFYRQPRSIDEYSQMLFLWGAPNEVASQVTDFSKQIHQDTNHRLNVLSIYGSVFEIVGCVKNYSF